MGILENINGRVKLAFTQLYGEPQAPVQVQTEKVFVVPHGENISTSGTASFAGYQDEEYLQTLKGYERAKEFDKMRRSDTQVKMLLNAAKNPIKAASWQVEAADDSPDAQIDKILIERILFEDMPKGFKRFTGERLTKIEFGHSVFEMTDRVETTRPILDPVSGLPLFNAYNTIKDISWINPKTITRWNLEPKTGRLLSITQQADGDLQNYCDVPAEFLLVFNIDQEGANYEGISWLRACYGNFIRKNLYLKLNAIGIEKYAIPTPAVKYPAGFQNDQQYNKLIGILAKYLGGEKNFLMYPDSVEMTFNNVDFDPAKVDAAIDKEDVRMSKGFCANFLELGTGGNSGAYALSDNLADFFTLGIVHLAEEDCEIINRELIPRYIKLNRGPRAKYPTLKAVGVEDRAGLEFAQVLDYLTKDKIVVPDDDLEKDVRARYKLPKKSLIGQRDTSPPVPMGFGGQPPTGEPPVKLSERIRKKLYG